MTTAHGTPSPREWPFPVPFGWFSAGYVDEIAPGAVEPRHLVGRDLVVWRDGDGAARVMDAYCPHLGAHLGIGGCVTDGNLVCPFHGWAFDAAGSNVDIPYADRANKKARVRSFPAVVRNGMIMFWYHPDPDVPPAWEIPEVLADLGATFSATYEWTVDVAWQEIAENAVDGAHFQYVHGTSQPGEIVFADFSGQIRHQKVAVQYNTKQGPFEGWQETRTYGPGFGITHFHIFGDAYLFANNTPIEAGRTRARFAWAFGADAVSQTTGAKFADEVERQFLQDIPIWETKRYNADPALAPGEKPVLQFRKWASQFYPTA